MNCARNIITANFSGGGTSATTAPLWQWDYGQVLCITGLDLPAAFEVHFSTNKTGGVSTVAVGADGQVTIPNVLLTIGKNLNAWIYLSDAQGEGETEYSIIIPVKARPMPEYYDAEATGEFDDVVRQVSEYAQTAQTAADNAGASATAAAGSASAAAASASSAAGSAGAAEQARANAVTAKGQAETAAQTATEKALQTAQNASQAASDAGRAESAAERAESAESGAGAAKTAAEAAAQSAAASAATADEKATLAGQSATAAAGSASAAAQSAASIEGDVQIASQKASEAQTAAGQAVTAKDAAVTAQTAAETSATNAGQSASTATTKAAEAATSASNAAQSKTDAETAATRAEQAAASLTVDNALSDTSENPVQNKVITGELTDVKSAIDYGYNDIGNLFALGYWTSRVFTENNTRISNSRLIGVNQGDKIRFTTGNLLMFVGLYSGSSNTMGTIHDYMFSQEETVLLIPNSGLLVITFKKSDESTMTMSDFNATVKIQTKYLYNENAQTSESSEALAIGDSVKVKWYIQSGGYINDSGAVASNTKYNHTDYIDVTKYDYLMYKRPGVTGSSASSYMVFYDAAKGKILSKRSAVNQSQEGYLDGYDVVMIPEDAKYARFSVFNDMSTYGYFEIYGHPKVSNIEKTEQLVIDGFLDITDEFIVSQYTSRMIEPNPNRIVNKILYSVKSGDRISYKTGDLYVLFGLYYGTTNVLHTIKDYSTTGDDEETFLILQDGLLVITFKNSAGTALSLNDFHAVVKLQLSASERKELYGYAYYGEKISLSGFNSSTVLTLDRTGGNPDDIAVYGDYLVSGVADDILRIYSISTGNKIGELTITNGSHFNVLTFSDEKYDNTDLLPLLYAETEGLNGLYNVIRIISLTEYEIVKKYRFEESVYGLAPQIYFDSTNNVAYGICIPLEGRQPMYDFYKFDLLNETENGDGTYTPAVLYHGKCPNPRTRQGGAYRNGRLYLMTTNASTPFEPKIVVYNVNALNPEIVSVLPNLPFTIEGEGLSINTETGEMYISSTTTVYKLTF